MKFINNSENPLLEIRIPSALMVIHIRDIIFIKAENKGCIITMNNANKTQLKTNDMLIAFEDLLSDSGFFRTHKQFLISFSFVICYCKDQVILHGNYRIPLSRKNAEQFRQYYIEFMKNKTKPI